MVRALTAAARSAMSAWPPSSLTTMTPGSCTRTAGASRASLSAGLATNSNTATGSSDPEACARCHKGTYCDDCHEIKIPHEQQWLTKHGGQGEQLGAACLACHPQVFCTSCHKLPMPHPADFRAKHGPVVEQNPATCAQCHATEFCQMCHKNTPPTWHVEGFALKHTEPATKMEPACILCHGIDYCAGCHPDLKQEQ